MAFNADSADRLIGGRYALEFLIGRGGMGEVWRARHVDLHTTVAIKFLSGGTMARESTRKRFLVEAQVAAKLKSKYAVQVFDFGFTDQQQPYLVMELLEGETLAMRIKRERRLAPRATMRFMAQSARALERAHGLGIVHRDFKPENVLLALDEEKEIVKICDFGVAKLLFDLEEPEDESDGAAPMSFSRSGGVIGTPYYMAPEQITNERDLGPAADIWAFGVVTFVCLTGVMPFDGKTLPELFGNILKGRHAAPRVARPDLPEGFEAWFRRACASDPGSRFRSARDAAVELAAALGFNERSDDMFSQMRTLVRPEDSASLPEVRVVPNRDSMPVRVSQSPPRPSLPPASVASLVEDARAEERARAYKLAIGAFVLGAMLALGVERLGAWLAHR